jgi:cytochrome c biogenesis protein CcmG, thiol:disulfide interchange protein DsbE
MASVPQPARAHHLTVGAPAPQLAIHTIDGQAIDTASMKGKVVIVAFWASWCLPCHEELATLSRYLARHATDQIEVIALSLDAPEDLPRVRQMAQSLRFPVALLGSAWAGDYGRIWRLPVSFVIDQSGMLANDGWAEAEPLLTEERLERVVTPLLQSAR